MIEELKVIAEMLKGMTDGALTGAILYLVLNFLKPVIINGIIGVTVFKVFKLLPDIFSSLRKEPTKIQNMNVVEIKDDSELP